MTPFGLFTIQRQENISEINATLIQLKHARVGCEVIAIINDDHENVFNISLPTFPENSKGTAHVLEHIVLCGSQNYPVKDPFFAMGRRSMNTFMNALTGTDFTCYPAASQIAQDFYNLLKVYLDAVFKPRLLEESFWQEGIHWGYSEGAFHLKGIVYNEMKGAMANPDNRLHEKIYEALFPTLPYRFNSGGNPSQIAHLTYEEVKEFHKKYYHPSRALYYFYGNLPLEKNLSLLEEHILRESEYLPPIRKLPKEARFTKKKDIVASYPLSRAESNDKQLLSIAYLTAGILEQEELLALHVLDLALMGTDAAPLKSAILQSGLCTQADSSLDDEISEIPYFFVFKGCSDAALNPLELLIQKTLEHLIKEGIAKNLIDGALHQLELERTEITGHSFPYGLSLFFRSGLLKQHGGDPSDGLKVHSLFRKLNEKFADASYIPYLINKYFLKNNHCITVTLKPDEHLLEKETLEEKNFVKSFEKGWDEHTKKEIKKKEKRLRDYQEEEEDLECLPRLQLHEVPRLGKDFPLKKSHYSDFAIQYHDCFTNHFHYSAIIFDLPEISLEDLPYLHLFTILAPECGCGQRNYKAHLDFIFQYTGGIDLNLDIFVSCQNSQEMHPQLILRGKSLENHTEKLFELYRDFLKKIDFRDVGRVGDLLKQHKESLENSIEKNPLRYALNMSAVNISKALTFNYLWQGYSYYEKARAIIVNFFKNPAFLIEKLEEIQERVLRFATADLLLTLSEEMYQKIEVDHFYKLESPGSSPFSPWKGENLTHPQILSQGRMISAPVAFTALSFATVPYVDHRSASISVASEIMENKTLHKKIREQGGAYGGGCNHSASWGYFYFHAYRDPHLKSTWDAFREAVTEVILGHFNDRELEEAKLGVFQVHDSPVFPEQRALVAYNWQKTGRCKPVRQAYRDALFSLTKKDIQRAAEEILLPGLSQGTLITFAGKDLLKQENLLLKEKALPIFPVN